MYLDMRQASFYVSFEQTNPFRKHIRARHRTYIKLYIKRRDTADFTRTWCLKAFIKISLTNDGSVKCNTRLLLIPGHDRSDGGARRQIEAIGRTEISKWIFDLCRA